MDEHIMTQSIQHGAFLFTEQGKIKGYKNPITGREEEGFDMFRGRILTPEDFGCRGEYESRSQGVFDTDTGLFSDTYFTFTREHIGWSFWQDGNQRRIVGVTQGKAIITPSPYGTTNINWRIRGQDDTTYFQAFLDALSPDYSADNPTNTFPETAIGLNGALKYGKIGLLTPGRSYPVTNTQAQYNAGKLSCLTIRRRASLTCISGTEHAATIVATPDTWGHIISNRDTSAYSDFVNLSNFTVSGDLASNSLDGIHWETPYGNYDKIDPFTRFRNISVERAKRHGYYIHGKGEVKIRDCDAFGCGAYGMFITGQYDVSVIGGQFGGNSKTGFRVDSPGPLQVTGIKSYYSGSAGGSNDEDCANIVIECLSGDAHVGGAFLSNVQCQESRGCGIIIKVRNCITENLQIQDPNRQTIGSGTRPTVKSGIYLKGAYACGNHINAMVMPALTEYATPNWVADTNVLYIDGDNPFNSTNGGPQNNTGDIRYPIDFVTPGGGTLKGITFTGSGAATAGNGCINGKNTGLRVNGVALT